MFAPYQTFAFSFFSSVFFNNPFQAGRETNNTMKNIRVNSCPFVVKKHPCPSVVKKKKPQMNTVQHRFVYQEATHRNMGNAFEVQCVIH